MSIKKYIKYIKKYILIYSILTHNCIDSLSEEEFFMDSLKWIFSYVKRYRFRMIMVIVMVLLSSALGMVNPYLSGKLVDLVIVGKRTSLLIPMLLIMIGVTLVKAIVRYSFQMISEVVSQNIIFEIREKMYVNLQKLDFDFFDKTRTGDLMARMTGDLDAIRHFIAWVIYNVCENAAIFLMAVIMMFSINVKFALIMLIVTPFIGYFAYNMTMEVGPTFYAIREQFSRLNTIVQENISGNRVVKAFAKEDYEISKFEKENQAFMDRNLESAKVWEKYLPVLTSFSNMFSVIMILVGGILVINGTMSIGELVVFNGLVWALNNPMNMVGWLINDIERFVASSRKIRMLINADPKIKNEYEAASKNRIHGDVEFKQVSFKYGDETVLEDINFKVNRGQTVAIIGPTGCGKSTLVSLVQRFYDVDKGEILIDGKSIKEYDLQKFRDSISAAMQDIFLFSDTIEGNIAYGIPNATFEKVKWAAEVSDADEFISNLEDGYDTIVGERGVGLSGGQKQRIALARAVIKEPSILILDDTTSSLDMETEIMIQKNLREYLHEKTTFIIAHRISSVKNADLILVMDEGRIIESGTHEELLKKKGYYFDVYENQYGNFEKQVKKEVV